MFGMFVGLLITFCAARERSKNHGQRVHDGLDIIILYLFDIFGTVVSLSLFSCSLEHSEYVLVKCSNVSLLDKRDYF